MRLIDADALVQSIVKRLCIRSEEYLTAQESVMVNEIYNAPTIEPKTKVIAQVTFDEDKMREIVHETIERIKEEYDIVYNPDVVGEKRNELA